jgi:class 3 adenylate cyclase
MTEAGGDEVLVSERVRNVVASSGLAFKDRGVHDLKGIEGPRRPFDVA